MSSVATSRDMETTKSGWQIPAWGRRSNCRDVDPETLFPENGRLSASAMPCEGCPVRRECLELALQSEWIPSGPWGGLPQGKVQALWRERHNDTKAGVA